MFFRIYFIYVVKVACVALALAMISFRVVAPWGVVLRKISMWILVPLCLFGALFALYSLFINRYLNCPLCKARSELHYYRMPALHCPNCGVVCVRNPLLDFKISVVDEDDSESEDE